MPRVAVGGSNPRIDTFVTILDPLRTATVTLTGTTRATYAVGGVNYTLTGTGFTVAAGKLTAGTITSITGMTAPVPPATTGLGTFQLTQLSLPVSSVNAAIAAENGGNALALDSLLSGLDWQIFANSSANTSSVSGLTGRALWFGGDGNDSFEGGLGDDNISGDAGNDFISANEGRDFGFGGAGNDTLHGDAGNDNLDGGAGADTLYGGDGDDALYGGGTDALTNKIWGGAGNDTISDGGGNGSLWGEAGDDKLYGGAGNDILNAGEGNDTLRGAGGTDTLYGGNGSDTLVEMAGDDILQGGNQNDTLTGGAGADDLYGGTGKDVFLFKAAGDLGLSAAADQIFDWETGVDKINLKSLNLTFVGTAGFTASSSVAEVRYNAASARLELDLDGDNTADAHILLATGNTLVASDLIL